MTSNALQKLEAGEFVLIAGPCVIESEDLCRRVAEKMLQLATRYNLPYIFKSSYKKANRLSAGSFSGPGLIEGLSILEKIRVDYNVPILTDIHETIEVDTVAHVADVLQIPAFLCRQTDLVAKAAATGKWVNIKKGQFLAPEDMAKLAEKANSKRVMLTERGTTFGYRNLVVDFRSFVVMRRTGLPVIYDVTHSLQLPGGGGSISTGQPEFVIPMARAAMAIGIDGLFVETHPNPSKALSDAGSMLPLDDMESLIQNILQVKAALAEMH